MKRALEILGISLLSSVVILALLAAIVKGAKDGRQQALHDAEHEREMIRLTAEAEHARTMTALKTDMVRSLDGDAAADRYALCVNYPPTVKANQENCAKLIARVEKQIAAVPEW